MSFKTAAVMGPSRNTVISLSQQRAASDGLFRAWAPASIKPLQRPWVLFQT